MPFLNYKPLKLKIRVFLAGHSVAMVTYCVKNLILSLRKMFAEALKRTAHDKCHMVSGRETFQIHCALGKSIFKFPYSSLWGGSESVLHKANEFFFVNLTQAQLKYIFKLLIPILYELYWKEAILLLLNIFLNFYFSHIFAMLKYSLGYKMFYLLSV